MYLVYLKKPVKDPTGDLAVNAIIILAFFFVSIRTDTWGKTNGFTGQQQARTVYVATHNHRGSALTGNRIFRCSVVEVSDLHCLFSSLQHNNDITTTPV